MLVKYSFLFTHVCNDIVLMALNLDIKQRKQANCTASGKRG